VLLSDCWQVGKQTDAMGGINNLMFCAIARQRLRLTTLFVY